MKPVGAIEVKIPCDFSTAAYFDAEDEIKKKMGYCYENMDSFQFIVRVNSVNLPDVIVLAYVSKFSVEVDFTYKEDEWSLTAKQWIVDTGKCSPRCIETTVWSKGA